MLMASFILIFTPGGLLYKEMGSLHKIVEPSLKVMRPPVDQVLLF